MPALYETVQVFSRPLLSSSLRSSLDVIESFSAFQRISLDDNRPLLQQRRGILQVKLPPEGKVPTHSTQNNHLSNVPFGASTLCRRYHSTYRFHNSFCNSKTPLGGFLGSFFCGALLLPLLPLCGDSVTIATCPRLLAILAHLCLVFLSSSALACTFAFRHLP